jgi:hypothetical protein
MSLIEKTTKINGALCALATMVGASAWFHPSVAGSDLWWHLAGGREIAHTRAVQHFDAFSHTFAGRPWTNHEWLWEVLYWGAYRLHPDAVAWLNLGVISLAFGLVAWLAFRASGSGLAALAVTWLAAATAHWFLDVRPHLVSLLLVLVVLVTRERSWSPWLWPPLLAVWANLHGGFVFGIGVVGLHVLFRTLEPSLAAGRLVIPRREWAALAAACACAVLLNPYGPSILEYPLAYLDEELRFRSLIEWHAPGLSFDPRTFQGRFFWTAAAFALGLPWAVRRAPYPSALAVVTFLMATTSRRFIPMFAVTSAPVAAIGLAAIERLAVERVRALRRAEVRLGGGLAGLAIALLLWRDVQFLPQPLYRWTQGDFYPSGAVRYLAALPDPPQRLFNLYNWGGYLMLHAPAVKVFIDGRANTLYDEKLYDDYLRANAGGPGAREVLRAYGVDAVLAPPGAGVVRVVLAEPEPWRVAYADPTALLLLAPWRWGSSRELPPVEEVLAGTAELALMRGAAARLRGEAAVARSELERAARLNPLLLPAYAELIALAAEERDRAALERWRDAALRAYPRQASRIHSHAAASFEALGDLDAALEALRLSTPRGPFQTTRYVEARIRRLEARRRAPRGGEE